MKDFYFSSKEDFIPQSDIQYEHMGECVLLCLGVSKKDIVEGVSFKGKGFDFFEDYFEALCEEIPGLSLDEAKAYSSESLYQALRESGKIHDPTEFIMTPLPLILLKEAIFSYVGKVPTWAEAHNENPNELICRCFGVFKGQIIDAIKDEAASVADVSARTKAGAGCGSCHEDIEEFIAEYGVAFELLDQKGYQELSPEQKETYLTKLLSAFLRENQLPTTLIRILQVEGNSIQRVGDEERTDLKNPIEVYLKQLT